MCAVPTNIWVRQQVGVSHDKELVAQLKRRKQLKYGQWKTKPLQTVDNRVPAYCTGDDKDAA